MAAYKFLVKFVVKIILKPLKTYYNENVVKEKNDENNYSYMQICSKLTLRLLFQSLVGRKKEEKGIH